MVRPKKSVPAYLLHRPSGQAVVKFTTADGSRHMLYLGAFNSPESREEYERVLASLRKGGAPRGHETARARALTGSRPSATTTNTGRLTQRLECVLHTDEVTGSNPVPPTHKAKYSKVLQQFGRSCNQVVQSAL